MSKEGIESERSELRNKNLVFLNQLSIPTPLPSLAHSSINQLNKVDLNGGFIPESSCFTLVGDMYGFLVWLSDEGIKYLVPDIGMYIHNDV